MACLGGASGVEMCWPDCNNPVASQKKPMASQPGEYDWFPDEEPTPATGPRTNLSPADQTALTSVPAQDKLPKAIARAGAGEGLNALESTRVLER